MRGWMTMGAVVALAASLAGPLAGQAGIDGGGERVLALADRVGAAASPQDPADEMYRDARRAMNQEDWDEAARLFGRLRSEHPASAYVGDAYYFEAFALHRRGSRADLDRARSLLVEMMEAYPDAASADDARQLLARVEGQRARLGDAQAAARVREQAAQSCESEEEGIRSAALSALLQMDPERAVPILEDVLRERGECSVELRRQAVFLVSQKMTDGTVDILLDLAHRNPDPDPEVREAAIFWLSQVEDPRATDALISILEAGDAAPEVQERVVFSLAQQNDPRSLDVLRDYAGRPDAPAELRENAIFWIGQHGGGQDFLMELYGTIEDAELRERILFSVAQSRDPESRSWLMGRAMDPAEDMEVRRAALFWAGQSGAGPEEILRVYRSASDPELREHAVFVLSQASGPERAAAVDALMEIARTEEDPELKERAVFWLGQSDDPRVPDFLLELIRGG